jgi:hypothetical protein
VAIELNLQRDPPQVTSFLHQVERDCFGLRCLNDDGDIAIADPATIVANPQEHRMLWMQR